MSPELLTILIQGLISVGGAAGVFEAIRRALRWRMKRRWEIGVRQIREMDLACNELCEQLGLTKVRILDCANSKGAPTPASPKLYTSVVWEFPRSTQVSWDREPCDNHAQVMMFELMLDDGTSYIKTHRDEIAAGSAIRNLYESEGIEMSVQFKIGVTKEVMFWATLHFDKRRKLMPAEKDSIRAFRNHLNSILD